MLKIDITQQIHTTPGNKTLRVDAEINTGELICFKGASGIGKTTILRMIAGLIKPEYGRISFKDELWCDTEKKIFVPASKRRTGLMFQDFALFPNMTVFEQVSYAQSIRDKEKAMELLECFDLGMLKDRTPAKLSGGQKQRVALARAIASEPSMLLLDEPFSALDWDLKASLIETIKYAHEMLGSLSLVVCHDPQDIDALAGRILQFEYLNEKIEVRSCAKQFISSSTL